MINVIKKIVNNEKLQDIFEIIAKLSFLLYTMLGFNSVAYGHKIVSVVMWPSFLLCAAVIGWRVLRFRQYYKMPGLIAMLLFLVSHGISMLLNHQYDLKGNIILMIYLVIFFLLFYVYPLKKEPEKARLELEIIAVFFIVYALIGSIASIYMLATGYSSVIQVGFDNYKVISGFRGGRLWGVFLEPSRASLMMMIAVSFLVYFISRTKKLWLKILCAVAVVPMFIYVVFSDSRTTVVSIFFAALAGTVAFVITGNTKKVVKTVCKLAVCLIISVAVAASPVVAKDAYNAIAESVIEAQEENKDVKEDPSDESTVKIPEIKRNYDLSGDISNRRFDIWKSGFEMFIEHPVFGYSYNGIRPYAMEKMPDTYIISNGSELFSNFHNEVINIITAQGIVGFLIFAALVIIIVLILFKNYQKIEDTDRKAFAVMMSVIFGLSSGAMFGSLMLYASTAASPMFWLCLGYMIYLLKRPEKNTPVLES